MATQQDQQQQIPSSLDKNNSSNVNLIELNETVNRIASYNGVEMVQILNTTGDIMAECINITSNSNSSSGMRSPAATPVGGNNANTTVYNFDSPMNDGDMATATVSKTKQDSTTTTTSTSIATASTARKLLQTAQQYILLQKQLQQSDDGGNNSDTDDEITFVQIRSKNGYELMIAPHYGFALVVVKRIVIKN